MIAKQIVFGSGYMKSSDPKVIPASREALEYFTYRELREYANDIGVKSGKGKSDTINNLLLSGKATLCATLGN